MRPIVALTVFLLSAPDLRAAVEVRVSPDNRVDVLATNAPLSEILDGLARQLKVKIVYEGPPPRQLLTVDLKGRTPAEAFLAVVEGQGLAYAVAMDKSGTRVETLLMAGGNNAPSANAGPAPAPPPPRAERPARETGTAEDPFQEEPEGEEEQQAPDGARPVVPHGKPPEPSTPTQGVYLPAPAGADYPTSVFAPRPPAPEPQKPAPKPESTPPPFNP